MHLFIYCDAKLLLIAMLSPRIGHATFVLAKKHPSYVRRLSRCALLGAHKKGAKANNLCSP
jgi:hypothetical protein